LDDPRFLGLSKKGLVSVVSAVAIVTSGVAVATLVEAADNKNLIFSEDLGWMKEYATLSGDQLTIDFSSRFPSLPSGTIELDATSSDNVVAITKDNLKVNITIKGFGATTVKVTAKGENGETISDQFQVMVNHKGDINGDGIINPQDTYTIYQVVNGKLTLSDEELKALDINLDGKVTKEDANLLMKNYVGKPQDSSINNNYNVKLEEINDAPIAKLNKYQIFEDSTLITNQANSLVSNDIDVEKNTLTVKTVTEPTKGALTLNPDGTFTYVPNPDFHGQDEFTYIVNDGKADSKVEKVIIEVESINDAPTASPNQLNATEDTLVHGQLSGSDVDGDILTYSIVEDGKKGTVTITNDKTGTFTYQPHANAVGADSFTYKVNDGKIDSQTVTVNMTITAVNDVPMAFEDQFTITEDSPLQVDVNTGLLANDTDDDNDSLTAIKVNDPANGTLTLNPDGSFIYTPNPNFHGQDQFVYSANDGQADSEPQTVTINVTPVNDAPIANPGTLNVTEDEIATGSLTGTDVDGDTSTYTIVENGNKGTVTITNSLTGAFTYTPNNNETGNDSFTFKVNDGTADSQTVTIDVTINAVNDAPIATQDSYTVAEDTPLQAVAAATLLANDIDVENDQLTAVKVNDPANGTLTLNPDGSFIYTPNPNFHGQDQFVYKANDGQADSEPQTVTITVLPVNDAPVAQPRQVFSTNEDMPGNGQLLASDVDGDVLSFVLVENGQLGTVTITDQLTGNFTYQPHPNAFGTDSFTFKVTDGNLESQMVKVEITINPINDVPTVFDVKINGKTMVGETLVGSYTFTDIEQDLEGASVYQWYLGTKEDGSDKAAIASANAIQYTIQDGDVGQYLFFEVNPVAANGAQTTQAFSSAASGKIVPQDLVAPTVIAQTPALNGTNISATDDFTITFSEKIIPTTGKVSIFKHDDDTLVTSYAANDTNFVTTVDETVTIKNPTLEEGTSYYVVIESSAFTDLAGNAFAGIEAKDWTFKTKAAIGSGNMTASSPYSSLLESDLKIQGGYIELQLTGDQFTDVFTKDDFVLNNAPAGLTIIDAFSVDPETVGLFLEFDGTDFDVNYPDFSVTAKETATVSGVAVTSNTMEITAEIEAPSGFISEYLVGDTNDRTALEIYVPGQPGEMVSGYELEVHFWVNSSGQKKVTTMPLLPFYANMPYIIINSSFYDFFDVSPAWYYNGEFYFSQPGHIVNGIVLKKDGQIVDVIGDINSNAANQLFPTGGTMVRQPGLSHGSSMYVKNQWSYYPTGTYMFIGNHTN
jgi:VCBS repeat-containing protein